MERMLCFLSVHTNGTRVYETQVSLGIFFFFQANQAERMIYFLSVYTRGTQVYEIQVSLRFFFFFLGHSGKPETEICACTY